MNSKLLFSSLVVGGGSIAAGGYGVYLATSSSFNPLKMAEKVVKTAKLLKETFEDLKEAKKKFLGTLSEEPWKPEAGLEDPLGQDREQLSVKEVNEQITQSLFKNIFLSKALENLLLQELSEEIKTKMEVYKSNTVEKNYKDLKELLASTNESIEVVNLAERFAVQVISLYGELPSLFKDQEKLFGTITLEGNENPLANSSYSPSLMSIFEKILSLEGDAENLKEGADNEVQNMITDNIFGLKISGTPILDSKEFVEILEKDDIFEVTTEKDDDSQKIKTLTLKLKKSSEQSDENPETMWNYFKFTNQDLKDWKEVINYRKPQEVLKIPAEK